VANDPRKQAEIDYPRAAGEEGRAWIRSKPFGHNPQETARFLIDFGYVLQLLDLHVGSSLAELGCGSGWMTRLAARHGVQAEGYDISPEMIEIARAEAAREGVDAVFEAGDYEELDLGRRFDACLIYDALHHSERPELVLAAARRALKPGGRLLVAEPNWKQRFQGRGASDEAAALPLPIAPNGEGGGACCADSVTCGARRGGGWRTSAASGSSPLTCITGAWIIAASEVQ